MLSPLMDPITLGIIALTFLALISPLLTFAALFQQKEWRMDRLMEHVRREGWMKSFIGKGRFYLFTALIIIGAVLTAAFRLGYLRDSQGQQALGVIAVVTLGIYLLSWVGSFALLSIIQIVLRKQRTPVWTSKALVIVALSLVLDAILVFLIPELQLLLPLTQAGIILLAWLLLKPLDAVLKKRVMDRGMQHRSQMKDATVIGIAGSVGKTTVKELIAHLLQDLKPLVTPAHVNTEMGVAKWINGQRKAESGKQILIVEMGAYRKGEIALLCRIAQPTIGVMTALGSDHLALFGSEQNIVDANGELIEALPKNGHAFFYGDNEGCTELAKKAPCPVTIVKAAMLKHPLEGRHNAFNVSLAAAVARHLSIKDERIEELLQTFKPQAHTFSVTNKHGVLVLDDTYNISPLSLSAALDWAELVSKRPRVLLTSGLQETGADENRYLTELGRKASKNIERVIFTDKHGSDIFAKAFGKPIEVLSKDTERVAAGSVLLAVGRMPLSTVQRLLPTS